MSKTCKKLLASALAVTMLFSTFVTSLVVSAATTGTLEIGTKTITAGVDTSATVDFTLTFTEAVEAPHELATIVAMNENDEALTITDVVLGDVTYSDGYVDENLDVNDPELEVPALRIKTDGINKTAGKVLFESGVDSAVKASVINFTVTFDTTNATVGTYTVSAVIDSTDLDESEIVVTAEDGAIVVAEPHVCSAGEATDNGDGTHDIACAGCDKLFADNEACKYVDGACSVCGAADPDYVPEEPDTDPVLGTVDMNWNSTNASLTPFHKFDIDTFAYSKHYLIRTDYWNMVNASSDVSYTFNVKGSGFNLEWGAEGVPDRTGYVAVSNLSIANIAYSMDFVMTITYTDSEGVTHIDTTDAYTTDNIAKINEIGTEEATALVDLINVWLEECGNGPVNVEKSEASNQEFDMTADVTGEIDMNWNSTNASLTPFHFVAPSRFAYSKHYLIRTDYYNSISACSNITSGFIVSGNGFNVQWEVEDKDLLDRTGYIEVSNLSISNLSEDITWTVYVKYTDAEGKTHLDTTQTTTNFMNYLNEGGAATGESAELIDALNTFYNLWSTR